LELYHGRTAAFKDMALSILPYLLTTAVRMENEDRKIVILTATSGDTGKAALEGFADVGGTEIFVFYPKDGVSEIQERQMATQGGANTHVYAIEGNFDDAQRAV
jgi:threonine synthase